ncbi:unnamed protein product [Pieris macdunnoughi]|uniref:Uncharacterized protein n=1 Tax=Pieris macdunnoughi TaxID=345717 RepID=A0A821WMC0_9NEOP|nr:unnamed protein product [Pieris macdunnoughi]
MRTANRLPLRRIAPPRLAAASATASSVAFGVAALLSRFNYLTPKADRPRQRAALTGPTGAARKSRQRAAMRMRQTLRHHSDIAHATHFEIDNFLGSTWHLTKSMTKGKLQLKARCPHLHRFLTKTSSIY